MNRRLPMHRLLAAVAATLFATCALAQAALTEGEVRKVDQPHGRITLKHEDIVNLDMPAMTMVFTVHDKSLLDNLKAGDRIRFAADQEGDGTLVVTKIEPRQ
jgi:Cu(I)/Ag(I) efflux system protein CusF